MARYSGVSKLLFPLLLVILVVGGYWTYADKQTNEAKIRALEQELTEQKAKGAETTKDYQHLTKEYEIIYKEKNGTANEHLLATTKALFATVFNYQSDKEEDSVKARKNKAGEFANKKALEGLFPKDADKGTSTVSTVSRMDKDPEVYLMSSDKKEVTALVVIHYGLSIAGSEEQTGTFMYKIAFDPVANQLTDILNVGEVPIP